METDPKSPAGESNKSDNLSNPEHDNNSGESNSEEYDSPPTLNPVRPPQEYVGEKL